MRQIQNGAARAEQTSQQPLSNDGIPAVVISMHAITNERTFQPEKQEIFEAVNP